MGEGSEWAFSEGTLLNDAFRHTLPGVANRDLGKEEEKEECGTGSWRPQNLVDSSWDLLSLASCVTWRVTDDDYWPPVPGRDLAKLPLRESRDGCDLGVNVSLV